MKQIYEVGMFSGSPDPSQVGAVLDELRSFRLQWCDLAEKRSYLRDRYPHDYQFGAEYRQMGDQMEYLAREAEKNKIWLKEKGIVNYGG